MKTTSNCSALFTIVVVDVVVVVIHDDIDDGSVGNTAIGLDATLRNHAFMSNENDNWFLFHSTNHIALQEACLNNQVGASPHIAI